jgi:hypothetical protein
MRFLENMKDWQLTNEDGSYFLHQNRGKLNVKMHDEFINVQWKR